MTAGTKRTRATAKSRRRVEEGLARCWVFLNTAIAPIALVPHTTRPIVRASRSRMWVTSEDRQSSWT